MNAQMAPSVATEINRLYQRALNAKMDWRVQLNVRNLGEQNRLVTVAVEPDGSVAQSRIASGSTYDLSFKLTF